MIRVLVAEDIRILRGQPVERAHAAGARRRRRSRCSPPPGPPEPKATSPNGLGFHVPVGRVIAVGRSARLPPAELAVTSGQAVAEGVDSTLGARVMPWALRSAAIISRRMAFLILVPDMGQSVTNRT